jgi:hypothetical protein
MGFDLANSIFSNSDTPTNYIRLEYHILKRGDMIETIFFEIPKRHYFFDYEIFDGKEVKVLHSDKLCII